MSVRNDNKTLNSATSNMEVGRTEAAADAIATINAAQNVDTALSEANDFATNNVRHEIKMPGHTDTHSRH